jgi:hypothetical protein
MGASCQFLAPATLAPGDVTRYPLYRRLYGSQSRSGRCGGGNNFVSAGNAILGIQLIIRRYTDSECNIPLENVQFMALIPRLYSQQLCSSAQDSHGICRFN